MQLKRADVVAGALALLDNEGLDALTMRKLGVRLGVQAGAIYRHFKNKPAPFTGISRTRRPSSGPWPITLPAM